MKPFYSIQIFFGVAVIMNYLWYSTSKGNLVFVSIFFILTIVNLFIEVEKFKDETE